MDMKAIREYGVSTTALLRFIECRKKQKLAQDGWSRKFSTGPMRFGSMGHECMQAVEEAGRPRKKGAILGVVRETLDAYQKKNEGFWGPKQVEDFEFSALQLEELIPAYFRYWTKKLKKLKTEKKFRVPFHDTFLHGYADGFFVESKKLRVLERKFRGRVQENLLVDSLSIDFQIMFELTAARQIWPKRDIGGALFEINRRPGLKLGKKETLKAHQTRVGEDIASRPEFYFMQYEIAVTEADLEEFEKDLKSLIDEFFEWCENGRPTRRYGNPCEGKYGLCEHFEICHHDDYTGHKRKIYKPKGKKRRVIVTRAKDLVKKGR